MRVRTAATWGCRMRHNLPEASTVPGPTWSTSGSDRPRTPVPRGLPLPGRIETSGNPGARGERSRCTSSAELHAPTPGVTDRRAYGDGSGGQLRWVLRWEPPRGITRRSPRLASLKRERSAIGQSGSRRGHLGRSRSGYHRSVTPSGPERAPVNQGILSGRRLLTWPSRSRTSWNVYSLRHYDR